MPFTVWRSNSLVLSPFASLLALFDTLPLACASVGLHRSPHRYFDFFIGAVLSATSFWPVNGVPLCCIGGEGLPLSRIFLSLVMDPLPYSTHDNRWIDDGLMEFPLLFAVSTFVNGCGSLLSDLPWIIVILLLSTASYYTLSTSSPSRQWQ